MAAIDSVGETLRGSMVVLKGTGIEHRGSEAVPGQPKIVPQERYDEAAVLFD